MSLPTTQLGEYLLHLPEDVAKHRGVLNPHPVRAKTEAKPPGAVKWVLLLPTEPIIVESIFIIFIFIVVMSHGIEERVPDRRSNTNVQTLKSPFGLETALQHATSKQTSKYSIVLTP